MSFLLQLLKLLIFAVVVLAAYAIYKPEAVAIYAPQALPYARMAHAYLPSAITGRRPADAAPAAPPRPPASVVTAEVQRKTVPWTVSDIGTAQAIASVALKSHFDATVMKVEVADGAQVKAGDVLFTLDDRQARAQLAVAEAQLAKDEAQLEQATRDVNRYTDLVARSATPIINLDNARTSAASSRASILGDRASIDNMKVALGWYTITAPISGRVGVVVIKAGNIVKGGDNSSAGVLATINQISPIYVALSVSQKLLPALREAMAAGVKVTATPQGSTRQAVGRLALIDNKVDPLTGTIVIRAEFANADELLWPGQLCNLTLTLREEPDTVVAPREAIQISQSGNYVFTVKDGLAHVTPVVVGRTEGPDTVIEKGLEGGEKVVVDGALLLFEGAQGRCAPRAQGGDLMMSLPELCIRRPVMTSLLMLSFIVFGVFGYRQLPVSALPRVDFPTIAVGVGLPGASPDTMASAVAGPLERAFATIPGHQHDDLVVVAGDDADRHAVRSRPQHRRRRARRAVQHLREPAQAAADPAVPAELPEGQSRRQPDPVHRARLQHAAALQGRRLRRAGVRRADLADRRRQPGSGVRRSRNSRCSVAVDPDAAAARGPDARKRRRGGRGGQFLDAGRRACCGQRQNVTVDATGQLLRADQYKKLVVAWRNGSPVRLDEIAHVYDSVENKQIAAWMNQRSRHRAGDVPPVRRQHGRGRRQRQGQDPLLSSRNCRPSVKAHGAQRPLGVDPPVDRGRAVHAADLDRARRHRHFRVPEVGGGDADSRAGAARFADRRLRLHVCLRLFHRQYFAARDHARGRLRRRRRHRHAGEHHPPYRERA